MGATVPLTSNFLYRFITVNQLPQRTAVILLG